MLDESCILIILEDTRSWGFYMIWLKFENNSARYQTWLSTFWSIILKSKALLALECSVGFPLLSDKWTASAERVHAPLFFTNESSAGQHSLRLSIWETFSQCLSWTVAPFCWHQRLYFHGNKCHRERAIKILYKFGISSTMQISSNYVHIFNQV